MHIYPSPNTLQATGALTPRQRLDNPLPQLRTNQAGGPKGPHELVPNDPRDSASHGLDAKLNGLSEPELDDLVAELRGEYAGDSDNPVQALLDAWGTESTEHDLNGDGTVNMFDLLALLQQLSQQPQDNPPVDDGDPAPVQLPEPQSKGGMKDFESRLQDLLDAWGTNDARSDINGDGIVDVFDLTELLAQQRAAAQDAADSTGLNAPSDIADGLTASGSLDESLPQQQPLTVENLMNAWGEAGGQFDLNDDGTVNMFDLLALLNQISSNANDGNAREPKPSQIGNEFDRPKRVVREQALDRVAERLIKKLHNRGYSEHPPANLDAMLERLNFADKQQEILKQKILASYPPGGSVNTLV